MNDLPESRQLILRRLVLAAAILVYLLIVIGGIVRATQAGGACLDWPTCFGAWTPPQGDHALLDYSHRLAALLAGLVLLSSAGLSWRWKATPVVRHLLALSASLILAQVVLGAALVLGWSGLPAATLSGLHLVLSLLALAGVTGAVVVLFFPAEPAAQLSLWQSLRESPYGRLSLVSTLILFGLLLSGALVSATGASAACSGWPLCTPDPANPAGWIGLLHRLVVGLAGSAVLTLFIQAWRTHRSQTVVLTAATATFVLFVSQALLGARLVQGLPVYLIGLHEATAVAVWAAAIVQFAATVLAPRTAAEEAAEAAEFAGRHGMARDLLMLTKPIVVALLLVTTYAGMVIGARAWPAWDITLWTLLGGFMAAGGSGAINQFIDRNDDGKMQRTQKRPIPSGRLTPGEGLAFGVALTVVSFYLMVAMVNLLAGLLTLAGTIYYVLLYSIFLKKTTVQNIVIGGGAGAIPPLVGWAAATGSLNIPSLFLFAVVFMWTPPHFWALALVRAKDYARAGVPMLPVIRGEQETQKQILIYTVELVALTLLLPLFGLGGSVYLVGAAVLGLWLLSAAWKVWKQGGNKLAWKMYRYSSMYLAFLFLVLMVDRLL